MYQLLVYFPNSQITPNALVLKPVPQKYFLSCNFPLYCHPWAATLCHPERSRRTSHHNYNN